MKKISLLVFALLMTSISITAKNAPIVGKWLLTKIEVEGNVQDVYQEVEFKEDGYMSMMGRVLGEWSLDKKAKTLTVESEMVKEFAGTRKIKKHNKSELILVGDKDKMYFTVLDPESTAKQNKESGLVGTWITTDEEEGGKKYITLELPDIYKAVTKTEYSTSKSSGNWMYNSKDKSIVFLAMDRQLRGNNTIVSKKENELVINHRGNEITLTKQDESAVNKASAVERLTFVSDDFYDDNGEPVYDDISKLPWSNDQYSIIENLKKIQSLTYIMSSLVEETKAFETKTLESFIVSDDGRDMVSLDNVFVGFDAKTAPEDYEIPTVNLDLERNNYDKDLFPFEGSSYYRVVSQNQEVTVPSGTYNCTTVEFIGDHDNKIKLWMINDNPGVLAKVIIEGEDPFGALEYTMFELKNIKK